MSPSRTIVAIVNPEWEYARGVIYGVSEYANTVADWELQILRIRELPADPVLPKEAQGVIVQVLDARLAELATRPRVPVVNVGEPLASFPLPCIGPDHRAIGQAAAEHFLERGFRHLGYVGTMDRHHSIERRIGFVRTAEASGTVVDVYEAAPQEDFRFSSPMRRWLAEIPKPAAIMCSDDGAALHFANFVAQMGIKVPEEVAIVGADNDRLICETRRPQLSSVMVPCERIGFEAAALLSKLMDGAAAPSHLLALPPLGVCVRESSDTFAIQDALVARAVKLMRQKAHSPTTIAALLRELQVSRRRLEYHFQAALGRSPGQIMRLMQLAQAKQMLRTTALPFKTIAVHCGFNSVRHFTRSFRQHTGLTPSRYRAQGGVAHAYVA